MTALNHAATAPSISNWLRQAEAWIDGKGKWAWIALMILSFIIYWPLGLAILAFMIWGKKMFKRDRYDRRAWACQANAGLKSTGNSAFDAYKANTLERLEQEQRDFEEFLHRLRQAKDQAEFDQFMNSRNHVGTNQDSMDG